MKHAALLALALLPACSDPAPEAAATDEFGAYPDAGMRGPKPIPADPRAHAIAEKTLEALGGRAAWDATRFVRWNFFAGNRLHYWDRATGDVRIEAGDMVVLMNIRTREGRVFQGGEEVTDPEAVAGALEAGFGMWTNDSYWVFMPYKLLDPGAKLAWLREEQDAEGNAVDVLELTFEDVGLTPKNRYEVLVDRGSGLVGGWRYQAEPGAELRDLGPWAGWTRFGGILLATDRGRDHDWQLAVYEELPASVFTDPAPTGL